MSEFTDDTTGWEHWPLTMTDTPDMSTYPYTPYTFPHTYPYTRAYSAAQVFQVPADIAEMIQKVGTEKVKHFLTKELERIQKELEEEDNG